MGPSAKVFKIYSRAYLGYLLIKWTILGTLFVMLSLIGGFDWRWLMLWPLFSVPLVISYGVHRAHVRKVNLQ